MMAAPLILVILMIATAMAADWQANPNNCGKRYQEMQSLIVGGEPAKEYAWPWQVAVYENNTIRPTCGGSLIDPWWVMTAAHCVDTCFLCKPEVYEFRVAANSLTENTDVTQTRQASRVIVHPGYNNYLENDIALFKMNESFTLTEDHRVNTICLPTGDMEDEFVVGQNATVTGWGTRTSGDSNSYPDTLYEVAVPIYNQTKCKKSHAASPVNVTDNMICAGVEKGGIDTCQGDSGGPLVAYPSSNPNQYFQVGIVSWGVGCGEPNSPGVYTRLTRYDNWIKSFFNTPTQEIYVPCVCEHGEEENAEQKMSPSIIAVISALSVSLAIFIGLTIGLGIYLYRNLRFSFKKSSMDRHLVEPSI